MSIERALALFDDALVTDRADVVAVDLDRKALSNSSFELPPLFNDLVRRPRRRTAESAASTTALVQRLQGLGPDQQHQLLLELVQDHIGTVLGRPEGTVTEPSQPFQDLGFDSLTAVELRNRLKTATGLALSPTLIFDYPTPDALAQHLSHQLAGTVTAGDGVSPLERQLRSLETSLATLQHSDRAEAADRLRALLAAVTDQHSVRGQIEAATTADELFRLIDSNLSDEQ